MIVRPGFVTNSSSSCMIVWQKNPEKIPENMRIYTGGMQCPNCGHTIQVGGDNELDSYMDERARDVVNRKLFNGCTIFYQIEYMGAFSEDETEHGTDDDGWYTFQC